MNPLFITRLKVWSASGEELVADGGDQIKNLTSATLTTSERFRMSSKKKMKYDINGWS